MAQSTIVRLTKEQAGVQKALASEQDRVAKLRADSAKLRRDAVQTSSSTTRQLKLRQAELKERDLTRAEKKLANLYVKKSRIDGDLARNLDSLRRMQGQEQRRQGAKDKQRRNEELRHFRQITNEVERQSRAQATLPTGRLTVDLARLPDKITVSMFAASPLALHRLGLDEEVRLIEEKLRASEYRDAVKLKPHWATRPDDLLQALNQDRPHVVHFSGHGNEDEIAFVDVDGKPKAVSTDAITQLMKIMTDNIRVVLFNTCESSQQAKAVTAHIDVAIGMNDTIDDDAARIFAASFYRAIGFGRSIRDAFEQGKLALQLEGIPQQQIPEMHVRDGVDPDSVILVRP